MTCDSPSRKIGAMRSSAIVEVIAKCDTIKYVHDVLDFIPQ